MTIADFRELLNKYKQNRITPEELQRLQSAVEAGFHRELIEDDILESLHGMQIAQSWSTTEAAKVLQHILQAPPVSLRIYRTWYLAATLIGAALLVGSLVYLGIHHAPTVTARQEAAAHKSISPGSNKALLTLSDGSTILLDSAHTGTLGQQGSAHVTNNGQSLAYNATGSSEAVLYNTVATPRGGQYQLTLADGSKVWLNAASSIRFPTAFTGTERNVEISGEAYFQVAANAHQPFHVAVAGRPDVQVNVLGTSFNVMAYADEKTITTTLETGAVQVLHNHHAQRLQPGYHANLDSHADQFTIAPADMEETLAWKEGKFRFRDTNIQTIMRQIARWYDVDVQYRGDVSNLAFTGLISRRENAPALLRILEATHRVHFEITQNIITVIAVNPS
ncbi:FecR family protein [Chitinophaga costaii]|uniref:FecR family protein n=1 Tax=Chitinophaga costaii TaxID=1335309 RepID=A0A1C4BKZ1_9BACT|nr:FecR family protein [Chitinophaga costaii]PUZ27571.1 FecR family protein [Chitinophaga costaii]SCC07404.1 FecR family protein [Chitinophaga costaii]